MKRTLGIAAPLVFLAALTALYADDAKARRNTGEADQEIKPQLQLHDVSQSPAVLFAARTQPVAPDALKRMVPSKLDRFSRSQIEARLMPIGSASMSDVTADFTSGDGRSFQLRLIDSAGFPQQGDPFMDIPAIGFSERGDGYDKKGLEVRGFAAVLVNTGDRGVLQVRVSPRLRLIALGDRVSGEGLAELARLIDLPQIAALAPVAAPPIPESARPPDAAAADPNRK